MKKHSVSENLSSFFVEGSRDCGEAACDEEGRVGSPMKVLRDLAELQIGSLEVMEGFVEGGVPVLEFDDLVHALENE